MASDRVALDAPAVPVADPRALTRLIATARGSDHRVGLHPCVSKICDTSHRRRPPKARLQSSISRETWAGAQRSRPAGVPRALGWLAPAVSEAGVVLDLVEGGVAGVELVADALDRRPHIRPIAILPSPGDEAFGAQAVVEGAIGHERADIRHQQMDE